MNKKERRKDIKEDIKKWTPSMLVLVETKVKPSKVNRVLTCLPQYWDYVNNYEYSIFGRVWICWNTKI